MSDLEFSQVGDVSLAPGESAEMDVLLTSDQPINGSVSFTIELPTGLVFNAPPAVFVDGSGEAPAPRTILRGEGRVVAFSQRIHVRDGNDPTYLSKRK